MEKKLDLLFVNKFKNKKILITGHTGFKGAWLAFWLKNLDANILGIAQKPHTKPSLFKVLKLEKKIKNKYLNINNYEKLNKVFVNFKPEIVFHLAAQAIVKKSYTKPLETFQSNSIGTLNILECAKKCKNTKGIIIITSDKAYLNDERKKGYIENDKLEGKDPYSCSKSVAELICKSYYNSYFKSSNKTLITFRAGNVIGGGDWSKDRIVPDIFRCWSKKKNLIVRDPNATRPWQHVLEPLSVYLQAGYLSIRKNNLNGQSFNIGPDLKKSEKVISLIRKFKDSWKLTKPKILIKKSKDKKEAKLLSLNCSKIKKILKWKPSLDFKNTIKFTSSWYSDFYLKKDMEKITKKQIHLYCELVRKKWFKNYEQNKKL